MTAATFKIGEHVSWNPEAGYVSGKIVAVHPSITRGIVDRVSASRSRT
jgi:hypothetical protein